MKTLEEIREIRDRMKGQIGIDGKVEKTRVVVGMATCGIASGARPILTKLVDEVKANGLEDVVVTQTGCIGLCQYEPIVEVYEPGQKKVTYIWMDEKKATRIVNQHLMLGQIVDDYTLNAAETVN